MLTRVIEIWVVHSVVSDTLRLIVKSRTIVTGDTILIWCQSDTKGQAVFSVYL